MSLSRRVGGVHLLLAGLVNGATGIAILALSLTGRLLEIAIAEGTHFLSPPTLLRNGNILGQLLGELSAFMGLLLLGISIFQLKIGWYSYMGRAGRWWSVAPILSMANPLAWPISLIAVVLLRLSHSVRAPPLNKTG